MPLPLLAAAPYVLQGISALGGIFGKKKKHMDAETLKRLYGPKAVAEDTQQRVNQILNSPYGQQLLASAAEQGQGIQTEMASRAAQSGLSPDTGGQSGASDFAVSAGTQAQTGLERGVKSDLYRQAMPIAAQFNQALMQQGLADQAEQNATPSTWQRIAAAAGQTAATIPMKPGKTPDVAGSENMVQPQALGPAPQMPQVGSGAPSQFRDYGMQSALTGRPGANVSSSAMRRGLVRR